jgi:uncharacterized protein (TIGR02145 family)
MKKSFLKKGEIMRNIIIYFSLLLFAFTLAAQQDPIIKFYKNNGSFIKFNIKDIQDIGLIKSQIASTMIVYNKVPSLNLSFDLHILKQILFVNNSQIQIILDSKTHTYDLSEIDSITVTGKPAPVITSIKPTSGKTGDTITITGSNFGTSPGTVSFTGSDASLYTEWIDTEIKVKIPRYASNGKLSVTVGGQNSNEIDFMVIPQITGITPSATFSGEEITISGSGFGGDQGTSFVSFNGIKATKYSNWSTSEIKVTVPNGVITGKLSVTVENQKSNEFDFSIKPNITSINPTSANIGDEIIITGSGFGGQQSNSIVSINGTNITEYTSWSDSEIKIKIPVGAVSGKLSVTVGGVKSNEVDFTLIPHITELIPASAKAGDEISISGIGFGAVRGSSIVSFAGINAAEYTSWSAALIKVKVPATAVTGKLSVTVSNIQSNEVDFILIPTVVYKTVTIGTQIWMKTNMDIDHYQNGDEIPQVTNDNQWANLTTGAWCYYLNGENYDIYFGKMYNWYAINDPRGFAPEGWRIPMDNDWMTLEKFLGMSQAESVNTGWRGTIEGNKLKQEGTENWSSPNEGYNGSGFTALGGGYRTSDGFFNIIKDYGGWWSISDNDFTTSWARTLKYNSSQVERATYSKKCGFSVRCIKIK